MFLHETARKCNLKRIDCHVCRLKGFKLPPPPSIRQSGVTYGPVQIDRGGCRGDEMRYGGHIVVIEDLIHLV